MLMSPFGGKPTRASELTAERIEAMGRFFKNGTFIKPTVKAMSDGQLCIRFEGGMFPSLHGMLFGITLTPATTQEEAEALRRSSKSIARSSSSHFSTVKVSPRKGAKP
jgi:hypothetical protein